MEVAIPNKTLSEAPGVAVGASVFAPVRPERLYEAVLDVRGFPEWAPGVRRVEVVRGLGGPGMLSEWEVSFLGVGCRVWSLLEGAERPGLLRWTYEGPVEGWGECVIRDRGDGTLAAFRTSLVPVDPLLGRLMQTAAARGAASGHLRRSLARLGDLVAGGSDRVRVGPPLELLAGNPSQGNLPRA
jgi:hypothetical protein